MGLTIAGTVFASRLATEIPAQLTAEGCRRSSSRASPSNSGAIDFSGVGNLGEKILASLDPAQAAAIAPFIDAIVNAIYEAISVAIASTFWVGIVAAVLAAGFVLFLPEVPMRATFEMAEGVEDPEAAPAAKTAATVVEGG